MRIRIVMAAEHTLMAQALAELVKQQPDLEVVGHGHSLQALLRQCRARSADVALVDGAFMTHEGIRTMRQLHRRYPDTHLVVLANDDQASVLGALRAGAMGCIAKSASADTLFNAIRQVQAGRPYFPIELTPTLLRHLTDPPADPLEHLSSRERQVLQLVATGLSSKSIAERLALSPKSVDTYRSRIMAKVGVRDVIGLVKFAILHGIISLDT